MHFCNSDQHSSFIFSKKMIITTLQKPGDSHEGFARPMLPTVNFLREKVRDT